MNQSPLPRGKFGAGYTVGGPTAGVAADPAFGTSVSSRFNGAAFVAFVVTLLLGPFVAPVTIPLAVMAHRQILRSGQAGAGLAKATVFVGVAYLAVGAVAVLLMFWPAGAGAGAVG
ncbi:MAG: DUF4190 domain-containing protein [Actinomycetota bacterium]